MTDYGDYGTGLPEPRRIPPWLAPSVGAPPPAEPPAEPPAAPAGRPADPAPGPADPRPGTDPEPEDAIADALLVRPFLVTGGRTQPLRDGLRVDTLVSAQPAALSAPLRFELRRIVEVCQTPLSVAEVAVRLGLPLGVARVLIADLVTGGYASCAEPAELSIDIIERIRDRVRAL